MSNFLKMRPMGAELFYVDRWIDRHNNAVTFYNFVNTPIKEPISWNCVSHHQKVTSLSVSKRKVTAINLLHLHKRDPSFFSVTKRSKLLNYYNKNASLK